MLRQHSASGSGNWQCYIKDQGNIPFLILCAKLIFLLLVSLFNRFTLFKKENKNFNNVKDLMKNAVFRIPLRKKKKKEIDSECQFALK